MSLIIKSIDSDLVRVHPTGVNDAHHLLSSVIHVAELVQQRLEAALAPTGLSLAKLGALRHLAEADEPLQLGQLAERIACVKSNVTQLIDRLEADGLVRRVPDPEDRRSVRAAITDLGRERYRAGMAAVGNAEMSLVTQLGASEKQQLHSLLTQLA